MPDTTTPQSNSDRLLKHLKAGSLAAQLVEAHRAPGAITPMEAMRAVLRTRLEQVRGSLDNPEV